MFTGSTRTTAQRNATTRRSIANRVVARPRAGGGSGADHG